MATSTRAGAAGGSDDDRPTSFGVHKPVDHLVISFPGARLASPRPTCTRWTTARW